jgi:membrane protease YdiL (CAAX protease family)
VFGLWHVRPTLQALRANGLAEDRRRAIAGAGAGVAVTAAGGALLPWPRERSDGLAAPMAVHLVTNSGGAVAAWASPRWDRGGDSPASPMRAFAARETIILSLIYRIRGQSQLAHHLTCGDRP